MEARARALATARSRLAAVSAVHHLAGDPDPASRPLVKATLKRLGREHGKPRKQARGLTAEALAAVRTLSLDVNTAASGNMGHHLHPIPPGLRADDETPYPR